MDALDSDRCGVGIRGVAMAIDSVVWIALFMIAVSAVGAITGQTATTASGVETNLTGTPAAIGLGLWLALAIGYHTLAEWWTGKTLGKYLVSIRVVAADGTAPSLGAVLGRNVLRLVDWLPFFYLVGIVAIALSDGQRRLGDRVAGTAVVRS
jgi:uncharacterized RDD family membrane protein YckC